MSEISDIKIESLKEWLTDKFADLGKDNVRIETQLAEFVKGNNQDHKDIQKIQMEYQGKVNEKLDALEKRTTTKEQYTEFFNTYRDQVKLYDHVVSDLYAKTSKIEKGQNTVLVYFSILGVIMYSVLGIITDYIKKHLLE